MQMLVHPLPYAAALMGRTCVVFRQMWLQNAGTTCSTKTSLIPPTGPSACAGATQSRKTWCTGRICRQRWSLALASQTQTAASLAALCL